MSNNYIGNEPFFGFWGLKFDLLDFLQSFSENSKILIFILVSHNTRLRKLLVRAQFLFSAFSRRKKKHAFYLSGKMKFFLFLVIKRKNLSFIYSLKMKSGGLRGQRIQIRVFLKKKAKKKEIKDRFFSHTKNCHFSYEK